MLSGLQVGLKVALFLVLLARINGGTRELMDCLLPKLNTMTLFPIPNHLFSPLLIDIPSWARKLFLIFHLALMSTYMQVIGSNSPSIQTI
jgi:hypothetical protein